MQIQLSEHTQAIIKSMMTTGDDAQQIVERAVDELAKRQKASSSSSQPWPPVEERALFDQGVSAPFDLPWASAGEVVDVKDVPPPRWDPIDE